MIWFKPKTLFHIKQNLQRGSMSWCCWEVLCSRIYKLVLRLIDIKTFPNPHLTTLCKFACSFESVTDLKCSNKKVGWLKKCLFHIVLPPMSEIIVSLLQKSMSVIHQIENEALEKQIPNKRSPIVYNIKSNVFL